MKLPEVLSLAVADLLRSGFDSEMRLEEWLAKLRAAARKNMVSEDALKTSVVSMLNRVYGREIKSVARRAQTEGHFTLANVRPRLRAELDRRIVASASLITLNRKASIERTLQRFVGWATSIPKGGSSGQSSRETKSHIMRGISGLKFEERRVIIDQGHKLVASINDIVARDGGAIAYRWKHVPERAPAYDARPDHVARNNKFYLIRNAWAHAQGLVKPGKPGYSDEVTQPAEEPFCRCSWEPIYALRDLPAEMLTAKGKEALLSAKRQVRAMSHADETATADPGTDIGGVF